MSSDFAALPGESLPQYLARYRAGKRSEDATPGLDAALADPTSRNPEVSGRSRRDRLGTSSNAGLEGRSGGSAEAGAEWVTSEDAYKKLDNDIDIGIDDDIDIEIDAELDDEPDIGLDALLQNLQTGHRDMVDTSGSTGFDDLDDGGRDPARLLWQTTKPPNTTGTPGPLGKTPPKLATDPNKSGSGLKKGPLMGSTKLADLFTRPTHGSEPHAPGGNGPLPPDIVAAADANRAAMQVPHQYRMVRKLHATEQVWLVQRVSDDMEFVGWRWDIPRLNADFDQLLGRGAGDAVAAVLNHPNLVSHIDLYQVPFWHGRDFEYRDYAISDYMDAGTLSNFIEKTPVLPKVELRTGAVLQWLPESLVWHVAVSLLNALTWLHEGVREEDTIEWGDGESASRRTATQTPMERAEDWWPILHRDIRANQVFFQHPRGIETYGSCKLGGFGSMFVSGHVHGRAAGTAATSWNDASDAVMRQTILRAQEDLKTRMDAEANPEERKKMYEDYSHLNYEDRPYCKGTETFKVGAILWQMMTRQVLPDPESCEYCQKNHWAEIRFAAGEVAGDAPGPNQGLPGYSEAQRQCDAWRGGVFRLDKWLAWLSKGADPDQPDAGYSSELIGLMSQLLDPQTFRRTVSTYDLLDAAKNGYLEWKETTEEGRRHVDLWDDLIHREKNRRKKEALERDLAVKQSGPRALEYVELAMGGVTLVQ